VPNALEQAKVAAGVIAGKPPLAPETPWFWSDQYDVKLQIAGLSQGHDRTETDGDPASGRFSIRYFAGDRLIAVDSINDPRSHLAARRALANPVPAAAGTPVAVPVPITL